MYVAPLKSRDIRYRSIFNIKMAFDSLNMIYISKRKTISKICNRGYRGANMPISNSFLITHHWLVCEPIFTQLDVTGDS